MEAAASSHGHRLTVSPGRQEEVRSRQHHRSFPSLPHLQFQPSLFLFFSFFFFLPSVSVSRACRLVLLSSICSSGCNAMLGAPSASITHFADKSQKLQSSSVITHHQLDSSSSPTQCCAKAVPPPTTLGLQKHDLDGNTNVPPRVRVCSLVGAGGGNSQTLGQSAVPSAATMRVVASSAKDPADTVHSKLDDIRPRDTARP